MTILNILSKEEIYLFERPPQFTTEERNKIFALPQWAEEELAGLKTPANKVGFITQYGYFQATKRFYEKQFFREADVQFINKRIRLSDINMQEYAQTSLLRHRKTILEKLGYQAFSEEYARLLADEADFLISKQVRLKDVFESLLRLMEHKRVEIPSYNILAHIITDAFRKYQKELVERIEMCLTQDDRTVFDTLLAVDDAYQTPDKQELKLKRYKITLLKETEQAIKPSRIQENIAHLLALKEYFQKAQPVIHALQLGTETIRYYATITSKAQIPQIARRSTEKYLYLLSFVAHQYYSLQDALSDIFLRSVQSAINKADDTLTQVLREQHSIRSTAVENLLSKYLTKNELVTKLALILSAQELSDAEKVAKANHLILEQQQNKNQQQDEEIVTFLKHAYGKKQKNAAYYESLQAQSLKLQKRVSEAIKHLVFDEESSEKPILAAIDYFRKKDGGVTELAPVNFLPPEEQAIIYDQKGHFRVSLYKALLFQQISLVLKSGRLNLKHSYRYRSLDDYMISKERWLREKDSLLKQLDLEQFVDYKTVMKKLADELDERYRVTNEHILDGTNKHISLHKDGGFSLTTPTKEEAETAGGIDLFPKASYIPLYEVLATAQETTNFLKAFGHAQLTHTGYRPDRKTFFAAIIGLGCNIGISKIGKISTHINQSALERVVNWYFSDQALIEANDKILSFTKTLYLPTLFQKQSAITHTTSDGSQYPVGVESLTANYSYKFKRPGRKALNTYGFKDSRNLLYYSTVFSPSDKEAIYVIDGKMHNNVVDPDMHSTDTGGVTGPVFAGMHLLNVFFAPRIKDIDTRQRYAFVRPKEYAAKGYQLLPHETIDEKIIEPEWDDILRFMATIKLKLTTASQLFHRLNSYSHQHPLYKALKEFGQIIQTIFILRYIDEPEIRQTIEEALNAHEHSNKFGKAVFYDHNHEFRQETREEQLIAEGCKRLIENAIILWNYLYLSEKVAETPEGVQRENLLTQIKNSSILTWQHINMQGEYDFSDDKLKNMHQFNISRILSLSNLFQTGVSLLAKILSNQSKFTKPVVV